MTPRFITAICSAAALALGGTGSALAATGASVGEIAAWGGSYQPDGTWRPTPAASAGTTAGSFLDPEGLGVDRSTNDAFVVDRTATGSSSVSFRVQQFAPGTSGSSPLATSTFTEPFTDRSQQTDYPFVEGIAVDPDPAHSGSGKLYMLVYTVGDGAIPTRPTAEKVKVFSYNGTSISAGTDLVSAPTFRRGDDANTDHYFSPQGIAIDPVNHDLVIAAYDASGPQWVGPMFAQRITTQTHGAQPAGSLGGRYVDTTSLLNQVRGNPNPDFGGGVSVGPAAASGDSAGPIYLSQGQRPIADLWGSKVLRISPDMSTATAVLDSTTNHEAGIPGAGDGPATQNPLIGSFATSIYPGTYGYGSPFVAVPDPASAGSDHAAFVGAYFGQQPPPSGSASLSVDGTPANVALRRLDASAHDLGLVTGPTPRKICSFNSPHIGLAAGSRGALYVLEGGFSDASLSASDTTSTRKLVQLGPGGQGCPTPQPWAAFKVEEADQGGDTQTVLRGQTVTLDARASALAGAVASELDWTLGADKVKQTGSSAAGLTKTWRFTQHPDANDVQTSVSPTLQIVTSDNQTTAVQGQNLSVQDQPALGAFQPPAPVAGRAALFDASASSDPDGGANATATNALAAYKWTWGDGTPDSRTNGATISHTFSKPGKYGVSLTVTDPDTLQDSAPVTHSVTVAPPTSGGGGGGGTINGGGATGGGGSGGGSSSGDGGFDLGSGGIVQQPSVPQPAAAQQAVPAPDAGIAAHSATVDSGGTVSVTVACGAGASSCDGSVTLRTAAPVAAARARRHPRKAVLTLGTTSFSIPGGQQAHARVRLNAKARKLLRSQRSIRALALVSARDPRGSAVVTRMSSLTLKPAAARRPRGHRH